MKPVGMLLSLAAVSLTACQQAGQPASDAATRSPGGIEISDARVQLPLLPGRPGAAYFTVSNRSGKAVSLAAVSVDGAEKAEMHRTEGGSMRSVEQIAMAPGARVRFEPGGLHVMVFNVGKDWREHATTRLTLIFADGEKVTAPVPITRFDGNADHDGGTAAPGGHDGASH